MPRSPPQNRLTLVLCIDRDNDLGEKVGIVGPIVGEAKNIEAAKRLAMKDPEDSDLNTIYRAVQIKQELERENKCEIVTLTGDTKRGVRADKKISEQLAKVMESLYPDEAVFVTDGADDDQILPIISSKINIVAKETVVVKQAPQLEKSYYIVMEALKDPYLARLIFGLPGIIVLMYFLFGLRTVTGIVGIYLIIKGFGMEEGLINSIKGYYDVVTSTEKASFPLYLISLFLFLLGIWAGFDSLATLTADKQTLPFEIAQFVDTGIQLVMVSVVLFYLGRSMDAFFQKKPYRLKTYSVYILSSAVIYLIVKNTTGFILQANTNAELMNAVVIGFIAYLFGLPLIQILYEKVFVVERLKPGLEVLRNQDKLGAIDHVYKDQKFFTMKGRKGKKIPFSRISFVQSSVHLKS